MEANIHLKSGKLYFHYILVKEDFYSLLSGKNNKELQGLLPL
jgi:hypothetical protein